MKFKLDVEIENKPILEDWCKVVLLGSCFAETQSSRFQNMGFDVLKNPFGIMYNPISLFTIIERACLEKRYTSEDFEKVDNYYFSWEHHGKWRFDSIQSAIDQSNRQLEELNNYLKHAGLVVLTFGSSIVHQLKAKDVVVANNRKLASSSFEIQQLSVSKCVECFDRIKSLVQTVNPEVEVVSTISPIRHIKSGLQPNLLSKSTLRVGLAQSKLNSGYFPAYEIFTDELRDYRFSKEDLVHPTEQASEYIWTRFLESHCASSFLNDLEKVAAFRRLEAHRPIHDPESHEQKVSLSREQLLGLFPMLKLV